MVRIKVGMNIEMQISGPVDSSPEVYTPLLSDL